MVRASRKREEERERDDDDDDDVISLQGKDLEEVFLGVTSMHQVRV